MTVFILNLAFADLTYCLINLPIDVLQKLHHRWEWSLPVCQFVANIRYIGGTGPRNPGPGFGYPFRHYT